MFELNKEHLLLLKQAMHNIEIPEGFQYNLPAPSFEQLGGVFLNYIDRQELFTKFNIKPKLSNPQGTVQGGIIAACFDDTFGPLGIVAARHPVMSIDINIQYVRAVPLEKDIFIHTKVISRSPSTLFLRADAFNARGKLMAQASTNLFIVK